MSETDFLDKFK